MLKNENENYVYEITYSSRATTRIDNEGINEILEEARSFNSINEITGCLLYHEGEFAQILEGKETSIKKLFERIKQDKRHHSVNLLCEGIKNERFFDSWDMAYSELNNLESSFNDKAKFENNMMALSEMILKPTRTAKIFWSKVRLILESNRQSGNGPVFAFFLNSNNKTEEHYNI